MAKKAYIGVENFTPRELPFGYTQVEYIESSGTQYIDTGYSATSGFKADIDIEVTGDIDKSYAVIGAHNSESPYGRNYLAITSSAAFDIGIGDGSISAGDVKKNTRYNIQFCNVYGEQYLKLNGNDVTLPSSGSISNSYSSNTVHILNAHGGEEWIYKCSAKIYACKLFSNDGTLLRDYVPCRNSDGTVGLYDSANGMFYSNDGTGVFAEGSGRKGIARKVKKIYVGVEESRKSYTKTLTSSDFQQAPYLYATGVHDTTYSDGYISTKDFYEIHPSAQVKVSANVTLESDSGFIWYDSSRNFISGKVGTVSGSTMTGEIPENAAYFKFNINKTSITPSSITAVEISVEMSTEISNGPVARNVKKAYVGVDGVARQFFPPGVPAATLGVGSTVYMNINGVLKEFIVVHQGIPSSLYDESCDGTWLLMKDIYEVRQWHSSNRNSYKDSTIHSYLNSAFLYMFDTDVQEVIKQVKIPFVNGAGTSAVASGASGLDTKIFLLSGYEVGFTTSDNSYFPVDGAKLSYFASGTGMEACSLRIGYLNGTASGWHLRSPYRTIGYYNWAVRTDGIFKYEYGPTADGVRPALVLPNEVLVNPNTMVVLG